ncbi:nuclease [Oleomonas cavernae]|uniref:Nuclease n=1 Tax=Oleomonas cavernae TaxID=2320859 RepID=A0A418WHY7_9PROT|nr:thermonuclease family protein [Oleomonas cavernae]RJF89633.1 nuclease [Oleomonas cavernae]
MAHGLRPILILLALAVVGALGIGAWATSPDRLGARLADAMPGPFTADVLEVVDGDTLEVRVMIWLGQEVVTRVRLVGIDTPELRGDCDDEKRKAAAARDLLARLVAGGTVTLRDVRYDKYGGRVLALVSTADGRALTDQLIAAGLARPYDGKARVGWCG